MYQVQPPRDTASLLDGFAHQTKDTGGFPSFGGIPLREFFPQHVAEIGDAAQLLAKAIVQFLREATPLTLAQFEQFKFKLLAPGDVADKPAGMDESPVFPQRIGVRQHMARGSVVGEKFGRNIVQRLAFGQLREHSRDRGRLRVKLAQGAADHLFGRPIQQVEEGAIGAKDRSIARDVHIRKAVFNIKLQGVTDPKTVMIQPRNIAEYGRGEGAAIIEQWLHLREFVLVGKAADNEGFESILAVA